MASEKAYVQMLIKIGKKITLMITISSWTKWSTFVGVIVQVISKSDKHKVQGQFEITSMANCY